MSIRQTERLYGYLVAAKNVEIEYEHYHGSYDIEPTFEPQVLETNELVMDDDLYIEPIPYDQYTGSTHVTPLPNNSVTLYTVESVVMDNVVVDAIGYDISDTDVTAGDLRAGKTAIDPTGTKITGTWNPPDVSGDTVTQSKVLAGTTFHDASGSQKTGSIPTYSGSTSYNPSPYARQTISCYQKYMASDIYINKIPYDITDTNVAANKMLIGTTAISPTGVKLTGNILTYSGSTVFDPDPEDPTTIPLSGKYVHTDLTINPIPEEYIVPTGTLNITENGTVDVSQYKYANVNVSDAEALALSVEILGVI